MKKALSRIKQQVRKLEPYTLKQYDYEIKLNQNENPFDVSDEIKDDVLKFAKSRKWSRYPEFIPKDFKESIAGFYNISADNVLIGNGSNELLQAFLMIVVETGVKVLLPQPTFTLYKLQTEILGGQVVEVLLDDDLKFDIDGMKQIIEREDIALVMIASPNNPTGNVIENDKLEEILQHDDKLIVVDEAYGEFSTTSAIPLLEKYDNLIIYKTFSKAMAMAGLRIGYMLASADIIKEVEKAKLPYNLNFFSHRAGLHLFNNQKDLKESVVYLKNERERVITDLKAMSKVHPYPSQANFIFFEVEKDVKTVFTKLVERGILIRDVSSYPKLSNGLRVTIGTAKENNAFIQALKEIMN